MRCFMKIGMVSGHLQSKSATVISGVRVSLPMVRYLTGELYTLTRVSSLRWRNIPLPAVREILGDRNQPVGIQDNHFFPASADQPLSLPLAEGPAYGIESGTGHLRQILT